MIPEKSPAASFFHSIRFRLTLWFLAVLGLILLVFCLFVYSIQARQLTLLAQTQLESRAKEMQLYIQITQHGEEDREGHSLPILSDKGLLNLGEYNFMALVSTDGALLGTAGQVDQAALQTLVRQRTQAGSTRSTSNTILPFPDPNGNGRQVNTLIRIQPFQVEDHLAGSLILGRPVDPEGQLPRLRATLILASLAGLLLALAGGSWLAARALAPVRIITRTARGIGETDLSRRLNLKTRDELGELADTFDAMLDRLQAAFNRQRQFTADASHELRTPLTIMGLEAEQALERPRTVEEYERTLRVIRSENEFMAGMVNDLLTLARMDAGQTALHLEALDLGDLALEVTERLSPLARRAGVEITLGDLPEAPVTGDRQYLSQMLANLVENAIKYAGGCGRHVRIEAGRRDGWCWLVVEDDGPGIPAESLAHLFDRFYRVDKARSREGEGGTNNGGEEKSPQGSGLGLSIARWVARAHNGDVTVTSQPGEGSRFDVRLPERKERRSGLTG